jgi:hypothetical protein
MGRSLLAVCLVTICARADAVYDSNIQGVLSGVWNYEDRDSIYFHLNNQPASHPVCNPTYFVIPSSVPADRRYMMFTRLLLAYASGETINIGYAGTGVCAEGSIRAIRVG